ncbi:hypothetical protein B0I00_1030 [Novosphingobium kunmingense]|uniref:Uncharacterized protein n=1 Tax=Novosphingobium kunmingense TaxID=1211806 RepID=A0A2N0I3S3_9SPHN|nr:hypothetical protein [Novosphingobium kunmingense]PKB25823.1 hypothetical protein B0I00_1030 [Novosphingobium kunmingense]
MQAAVKGLFHWMPLLFGIGFIAPLIAQVMVRFDVVPPLGITPLAFGLLVGAPWGLVTVIRGRWL